MEKDENRRLPNEGRQIGIDLAKCFAIIFMVIIHCLMEFEADSSATAYQIFDITCGSILAAPVFMTAMGVGLAYSKKSDPKKIIFRGLHLLFLNYFINLLMCIPNYIIAGVENNYELLFSTVFYKNLGGDILAFAGLTLILFGLLKLTKIKDYYILLIGIILSLVATFIPIFVTNNIILENFTGLFFLSKCNTESSVAFPLISWFICPAFGYWYGNLLKKSTNPNYFHLIFGIIGTVIAVVGFILCYVYKFGFAGNYSEDLFYGMKIFDSALCISAAVGFFGLCHFISKLFNEKLVKGVSTMSNALNLIYIIHWILIAYITTPTIHYGVIYPVYSILLIAVGIIITATTLGILLKGYIKKKTLENPGTLWRIINA